MSTKVELATVMKIFNIFVQKRWTDIEGYDDVLNRFGVLVNALKQDEVELLIELIEQYEWMSYNDYHTAIRRLLISLLDNSLNGKKRLFIFPVIKPSDESKIKSGHAVMYMITSIIPSIAGFKNIEILQLKEFKNIKEEKLTLENDDFLILVDDYIGSGNTLNRALSELQKNSTLKNNFAIFTIAMQEQVKARFSAEAIEHYCYKELKRGISDVFSDEILVKKTSTMKSIENRISNVRGYRHGYERSEALITLIKTPNNTFPIFWKSLNYQGEEIAAPFQRHQ